MSFNEKIELQKISTKIYSGGTPSRKKEEYWLDGKIPWLKTNQIGEFIIYNTDEHITEKGLNESSTKLVRKNSLVIAMYGDGVTRGKVSIVGKELTTNQACCVIEIDPNQANYKFIYYQLKQSYNVLRHLSNGGAQQNLNVKMLKEFKVKLPLLTEQNKIAEILYSLDKKIETNNKINKKLEEMAQAIFKQWFIDFEFPNEDGKPYKSSGGEMVESELGMIPKSYLTKNLNEIVEIKYGKNLPTKKLQESGYPVFGGNGIIGYYPDYLYEEPQVLIACRGAASGKVATSLPFSFITNNSLVLENTGKEVTYEYLRLACLYKQFFEYATGSAQPQITINNLSNVKIIVPNRDIIKKFSNIINSIDRMILNNNIEIKKLIDTREFLLPKLMSGEIRVPMD